MVRRALAAVAMLSASAALLAGCGGGSVTKPDVVARANAICSTTLRQARALGQGGAAYYGQLAGIVSHEAKQLRALPRPATDRAVLDLFIASVTRAAGQYQRLATAARHGDQKTVSRLSAQLAANPEATYATSYGLRECAGTSGTLVSG